MAKYTGTVLTKKGKELLARATLGETITLTKVEIGKGVIPEGTNKEDLISLIESFKTLSITNTTILEAGNYRVRVAFNNKGITQDTYLREIGLFARGEDGIEVLYSYCDTSTPDLIPRESSGVLERVEDIITYISSAGSVNAVIDQSNVYATIKDLNDGLLTKENKFTKNSGFNLDISHLINSTSKVLVASAYAVKLAYDKALEAIGFTNTNKNAIQNNQEQIEILSKDSVTITEKNVIVGAVETARSGNVVTLSISTAGSGSFAGNVVMAKLSPPPKMKIRFSVGNQSVTTRFYIETDGYIKSYSSASWENGSLIGGITYII